MPELPEFPEFPEFPGLQKLLGLLRRAINLGNPGNPSNPSNPSNLGNPGNPANPSNLGNPANLALLVAQRRDRIDPGRAAGGPEGGEHADEREEDGDADVGDRVERIDPEQQRPQHAGSKRREHEAG